MKKLILPLAIAATLLAPGGLPAAQPVAQSPLTLAQAIALALRSNPELRAAAQELAAQDGAVIQAGALPNPELELLREGHERPNRSATVQLNVPIEMGGKRAARVDASRAERRLAALALEATRARVHADTVAAFHELLVAKERSRLAAELAALAHSASDAARKRVLAGKVSPVEENRARVAEAGVRIEALQAARELDSARIRLAALWRGDPQGLEVAGPAPVVLPEAPPLAQLLHQLENAPAMLHARAQVDQRQALVQVERTRRVPDVNVIVGAKREDPERRIGAVLGVSVPLPLFDRKQGALLEALRRTDKARDERDGEATRLRAELGDAHARLGAALQEAGLIAAEILPGAEDTYRAASRGFELGKFSFLEVLDAQRTLFQSKNQYLRAVAESHRAAADIARIVGMPQPAGAGAASQETE